MTGPDLTTTTNYTPIILGPYYPVHPGKHNDSDVGGVTPTLSGEFGAALAATSTQD
ncbi:MAG: hypothetical protein ABI400_06275 [Lacisediminihabitans sp.]